MAEDKPPEEPAETINLRAEVPAEIRNAAFPVSVRGYDRRAVDLYVQRVNRVIAELEVTRSPQAAVRHAVERVSEQTKGILQEARESAEKITEAARAEAEQIVADARAHAEQTIARANAQADERRRRSEEELAALEAEAQARMRELQADTEAVWKERQELLGDIDAMASRLQKAASTAAARFSREEAGDRPKEPPEETEAALHAQPTLVTAPDE